MRVLFRCVVLAFLVYAMLLTWWTRLPGTVSCIPSLGRSTAFLLAGAGTLLVVLPELESQAGGVSGYFYRDGRKVAVLPG
ncbi:MAG: hypothetical protein ACLU7D_08685 [Collinsella sp.]